VTLRRRWIRIVVSALGALLVCAAAVTVASGHPSNPADVDHDLLLNEYDNCPANYNPKQQDNDKDSEQFVLYESDPQPLPGGNGTVGGKYYGWTESASLPDGSPDPRNRPVGFGGDACDEDDDNDGFPDKRSTKTEYRGKAKDNCPKAANPGQEDADSDGAGDICDTDDDNDGVLDTADNCATVSNVDQKDTDGDKAGDACDPDAPKGGSLRGGDPNDKTAPTVKVSLVRRQRFAEIALGIAVPVRCSEGCAVEGELMLDKRTALKLKIARKAAKSPVVVARCAAQIEDKGFTFVFVKMSKASLKRLERARRVRPKLRVTAKDANGNRTVKTLRLQLRR
jgi:hypothetical protein